MAHNPKLAPLLTGRVIAAVEPPPLHPPAPVSRFVPSPAATWHVRFADGWVLAVRTDGTGPQGADSSQGGKVADVVQHGTTLTLTVAAGEGKGEQGTLVFHTAEEGGCVMLRDAKGGMEYAD